MDFKKIIWIAVFLLGSLSVWADGYSVDEVPNVQLMDRNRYVSNPDGILSAQTVRQMDQICASLRERGYAQVAVVALSEIEGDDLYSFAIELFEKWGVGGSEADNGLGILLVRDRHEIRFVTGEGVEGVLPDALCKRIQLKYMLPAFRQDDYDRGMLAGLAAAAKLLEGGEVNLEMRQRDESPWWLIFVFVGLFYAVGAVSERQKKRCPRCHKNGLQLQGSQEYIVNNQLLTEYTYVCRHCGERVTRRVRSQRDNDIHGGWGGPFIGGGLGGFGGGGFGGGGSFGGGFGGGSFGGGGAGSRW